MKAMILAAGEGKNMMPLTRDLPKPLLEVHGKSLIDYHIEALRDAGFEEIIINLYYLGEKIKVHLGDGSSLGISIRYSFEPELLETAGGIQLALPLLGDQPFAVISGDIFTDYDYRKLRQLRLENNAHLIMVDSPEHHPGGDFSIDSNGVLRLTGKKLNWSSIGVFSPAFFASMKPGKCRLRKLFDSAVQRGELTGESFDGLRIDVGTPERLHALEAMKFETKKSSPAS